MLHHDIKPHDVWHQLYPVLINQARGFAICLCSRALILGQAILSFWPPLKGRLFFLAYAVLNSELTLRWWIKK